MPKKTTSKKLVIGEGTNPSKPLQSRSPPRRRSRQPRASPNPPHPLTRRVQLQQRHQQGRRERQALRRLQQPKPRPKERPQKEFVRDPRPHFNVVFCGHVDAGKSTISGHLLADNGLVDEREMEKLKREAIQLKREGWEYAYVMDVSEEERAKGKTHEIGSAYMETKERRLTILDAPGHKAFVPSMIGGATQADLGVMVVSARTGEYETGFEKGGQTREHHHAAPYLRRAQHDLRNQQDGRRSLGTKALRAD